MTTITATTPAVFLDDPNPAREQHTFAGLVAGHEDRYPLLARAVANASKAQSYKIEWLVEVDGVREKWENYTQITRWPYDRPSEQGSTRPGNTEPGDSAEIQKHWMLAEIEHVLFWGKPTYRMWQFSPRHTCGGYVHFLGRELRNPDFIGLRILREPFLWVTTHDLVDGEGNVRNYDEDFDGAQWRKRERPIIEWIAEYSLEVSPGL